MTHLQAKRLATRIVQEYPTITVTGLRHYDYEGNSLHGYVVEVVDTVSGIPMLVHSPETLDKWAADAQYVRDMTEAYR